MSLEDRDIASPFDSIHPADNGQQDNMKVKITLPNMQQNCSITSSATMQKESAIIPNNDEDPMEHHALLPHLEDKRIPANSKQIQTP